MLSIDWLYLEFNLDDKFTCIHGYSYQIIVILK